MAGHSPRVRTLLVFARVPVPGTVKTRLVPPLSREEAARLQAAFLKDILGASRRLRAEIERLHVELCVHPFERRSELPDLPDGVALSPQEGESLAERMAGAVEQVLGGGGGAGHLVLRNCDSPLLPQERLREAFLGLEQAEVDLVLGPDLGGGYYLVGLKEPRPALFDGLPLESHEMGDTVFQRTMQRARELGLGTLVLRPEPDVDLPEDLARLVSEAEADPALAPETARVLAELRSTGLLLTGGR